MKKFLIIACIACMLLSLAACGDKGENTAPTQPAESANAAANVNVGEDAVPASPVEPEIPDEADGFSFSHKGVEISFHAPAAPIVEALGEPIKYTETTSCAFEGLDKSYYYGSFYLETYPVGDEDFVYGWWFADDGVATPEGIYIGAELSEVEAAYGSEGYNGSNAFVINKEAGSLAIILTDGVVSSIQYAINIEE